MRYAKPEAYSCSVEELCALSQKKNLELIRQIVNKETAKDRKIIFFGWSMGGPQALVLAADVFPEKTAAVLGYAATGPLNYYRPRLREKLGSLDLKSPYFIPRPTIDLISDSPLFPKKYKEKYIREYLIPMSPLMVAIQRKLQEVKDKWSILTVQNPRNIPPLFLINGSRDQHGTRKGKALAKWAGKFQKDVTLKYARGFCHLGMLCRGNEKLVDWYLNWLTERGL